MSDRPEHDALMALLHPDPDEAAKRFKRLWSDLLWYLERRRCHDPEGSASEAVKRAIIRVKKGDFDPADSGLRKLIFGIAWHVCQEGWRLTKREQQAGPGVLDHPDPGGAKGHRGVEAARQLEQLRPHATPEEWTLLERYYTEDDHAALARELGLTPVALRVRVFRAMGRLRSNLNAERKRKKA